MKKINLSIVMMLVIMCTYAQELPEIIPPSPESSALSRFDNIPVSHYTGLPNISIPFYTINTKDVEIPIALNYHARGVKVSEIASRTGMGWSLSYGGIVTRQKRGKADELGGFLDEDGNQMSNYHLSENTRDIVYNRENTNQGFDFYPDQFTFNIGGVSGKFVFDYKDKKPVIQSFGDIDVDYEVNNQGKIVSFIITNKEGTRFYFGISKDRRRRALDYQISNSLSVFYDRVVEDSPNSNNDYVYSSWKLMDIETYKGDLISYFYEDLINSSYWTKSGDLHVNDTNSSIGMGNLNDIRKIYSRVSRINNYEKNLSKIEFNKGRDSIKFVPSREFRNDFNGYSLDEVKVYSKGIFIKGYKLNYDYKSSLINDNNMLSYFKSNLFEKYKFRMFLKSVEQIGIDEAKLPPYIFKYNETKLPHLFSTSQDFWGYYNGALNNGPFLRMFNYGNYKPDRKVDTVKSEAGLLKEIRYPTGGKTKFFYEHNKGSLNFDLLDLKIPEINPGKREIILTKQDFNFAQGDYEDKLLTIPPNTSITFEISCFHLKDITNTNIPDCLFEFKVNNYNIYPGTTIRASSNTSLNYISIKAPRKEGVPKDLHRDNRYDFKIKISYNEIDSSELYGPGKRIKRVEQIDENGVAKVKEYKYSILDNNGKWSNYSGSIRSLPSYVNKKSGYENIYIGYNDSSGMFSSFQENIIGYSYITEFNGTSVDNSGKTEFTFSNIKDTGGDYYEFPYHPPTDNEWLRGKLIQKKVYKKNFMNEYVITREIYNKYQHSGIVYSSDFIIADEIPIDFALTPKGGDDISYKSNYYDKYTKNKEIFLMPLSISKSKFSYDTYNANDESTWKYRVYFLTGGTIDIYKTIEKEYNETGILINETIFKYDYNNHYQLKSNENINSKGEILKTNINYDVLSNPFRTNLTEITKFKGRNKISHQKTVYSDTHNSSGLYLPSTIQTSKGTQVLEDRIVYHSYDELGNPQEVSKADGPKIYYIWGYNKTHPIAKIEGYSENDISSASTIIQECITASNNDVDQISEDVLFTKLSDLRTALSRAKVSTYTYDPLIGVTSITDPRGETIYYEYDEFNRLKFVKDSQENILKQHEYNYKNE